MREKTAMVMLSPAWTATGTQIDPVSMRSHTNPAPATVVAMTVIRTWATPARLRRSTDSA